MPKAGQDSTRTGSSLASKVIRATFALALLSTGVIFAARMIFIFFADRIDERVTHELVATNSLKRQLIETEITERFADATLLAERRIARAAVETDQSATTATEQRRELSAMAREWRDAYRYQSVTVVDRALKPVATTAESAIPREALNALVQAMESGKPTLIDLFRGENARFSYGVAAPIFPLNPSAKPTGAVYVEVDAEKMLLPLVESWPTDSDTAESVIFRKDGEDVLYLGRLRNLPGVAPQTLRRPIREANLLAVRALRGEIGMILSANDYRGVPVIGIATKIAETPWRLISKIDKAEAEADVVAFGQAITALAALFFVITASLLHYIRKSQKIAADRKQAILADEYSATIEATSDAFLRLDVKGNILHANSAAERMTGYSQAELLRNNVASLRENGTAASIEAIQDEIRQSGSKRFETRWRHKDGGMIDLDASVIFMQDDGAGHFLGFLRDISESKQIRSRLERLNRYHEFLAHVTTRIFGIRDAPQILKTFCESAVAQSDFVLAWAGIVDAPAGRVRVAASAGQATDYVQTLVITLDPALPTSQGPTGTAVREMRSVITNDFLNDPHTVPWRERAQQYGIRASAAVPVIVEDRAVGALMFYADAKDYFDEEMTGLLEETARKVSLAWAAGNAQLARDVERDLRRDIAARYESVFKKSPLPSQIHDATTGQLMAINEAHRLAFGYSLQEVAGESAWFDQAYPDPVLRERLRESWMGQIEVARQSGRTEESPEQTIRCRDGSHRTVRGFMTVAGNDAIMGWVDLTEVRRRETELRESETRFRGMVEQSISGFYVVQDGQIIYANQRLAEILGHSRDEIVGHDVMDFVVPEEREKVASGRRQLIDGVRTVSFEAAVLRKNGNRIVVGVTAAPGMWDDRTVTIAIVEDITERSKSAERLSDYVKRLENSMRGTLNAVARMVDLRDPYTAGHQRRVGLIAADIARELGWEKERADTMELIGLVHDIGKIAVPAELLSKPTRLSATEFELIKGHAQASYDILKDVQFDVPVADIIVQHHERLDGSGYPRGLKGDEISPEGRLLAVADVLESMASHRPYRPALGIEAAIAELDRNRETFYDGHIVDTVKHMVNDKGYTLPQ